jgi:ActR/RegA family two-component response regulator
MNATGQAMERMLVIDDNRPYVEALHRDAQRYGITLAHAGSLEEGREILERRDGWSLTGVVLDVKCLKERSQQVPDSSFLAAAVRYFGEKAPHLPMVVLTGEPDQFRSLSELYAGTLRVFSKGRDEAEMLSFLRDEAGKLDYVRVAGAYPEAFATVRSHLGSDAEQELFNCLRDMTCAELVTIKNTLGCLRRLQERIYIALSRADGKLLPSQYVSGEINLVGCYKHLVEKGVVERYRIVDRFAELIYKITSDSGAHSPYADPKYPPTSYTVRAVVFALLDLILWFGGVMEEYGLLPQVAASPK